MNNAVLENVRMGNGSYRNFEGRQTQFNPEGNRNFTLFLDADVAKQMEKDGWPIRWKQDRYDEDVMNAQLKVSVKYHARDGRPVTPPKIVVISHEGQVSYDESMVSLIDGMEIEKCDVVLRPYEYKSPQREGVAAYLKTMYITLQEDELDLKYRDSKDSHPAKDEADIPW